MGNCCPLQNSSLQSLRSESTVSAKATCTIRPEVLESRARESPIASELQTETEAEVLEVSVKTAPPKKKWMKEAKTGSRRRKTVI
jgi:hypothetical protein